jgi:hypothetical protein
MKPPRKPPKHERSLYHGMNPFDEPIERVGTKNSNNPFDDDFELSNLKNKNETNSNKNRKNIRKNEKNDISIKNNSDEQTVELNLISQSRKQTKQKSRYMQSVRRIDQSIARNQINSESIVSIDMNNQNKVIRFLLSERGCFIFYSY